jgi:hypothetical protein
MFVIVHLVHLVIVDLDFIKAKYIRASFFEKFLEITSFCDSVKPVYVPMPY